MADKRKAKAEAKAGELPEADVYEAIQPFAFHGVNVPGGSTVVAGHPMLEGRSILFRPFRPTFGLPVSGAVAEAVAEADQAEADQAKAAVSAAVEEAKTAKSDAIAAAEGAEAAAAVADAAADAAEAAKAGGAS